jgi:hypothetical protein
MKMEEEKIGKIIKHLDWLNEMNIRVRLANPKPRHDGYEMAINDALRFIHALNQNK